MIPQRWQRSRKAGAKQPEWTLYVGRSPKGGKGNPYANPHIIRKTINKKWSVWIDKNWETMGWYEEFETKKEAHEFSVSLYKEDMKRWLELNPSYFDKLLGYKYISCFCPLDMPCHCDAIIEHLKRREQELKVIK